MKQLILPYIECSDAVTVMNYNIHPECAKPGIYKIKTGETYVRILSISYMLAASDVGVLQDFIMTDVVEPVKVEKTQSIQGISENALLAAIAIAQDSSLAPTLLSLRQTY